MMGADEAVPAGKPEFREFLSYFFKLGLISFGGPVAQIGIMHRDLVERKGWITEEHFVRIFNFCNVLPGPEALQMAIYIGYLKRRLFGGIIAGLTFIVPSFFLLLLLSALYAHYSGFPNVAAILYGVRPVALALVAAAFLRISRATIKNLFSILIAAGAFLAAVGEISFIWIILGAGALGLIRRVSQKLSSLLIIPAVGLLLLGPVAARAGHPSFPAASFPGYLSLSWFFLKVGLVTFGGAYSVLTYLRQGAVDYYGWISPAQMTDGLALGETTPGPLIIIVTFIGYLAGGAFGAFLATFFTFVSSFLFVFIAAPYAERLSKEPRIAAVLSGVTFAVVGVILHLGVVLARGAFVDLYSTGIGLLVFLLLVRYAVSPPAVVLLGAAAGLVKGIL